MHGQRNIKIWIKVCVRRCTHCLKEFRWNNIKFKYLRRTLSAVEIRAGCAQPSRGALVQHSYAELWDTLSYRSASDRQCRPATSRRRNYNKRRHKFVSDAGILIIIFYLAVFEVMFVKVSILAAVILR